MREKVRERSFGVLRNEARSDFRDHLFSIFIGNLNPTVDSGSLWEIFKPQGKVRDIFLSLKTNARKRVFAFVHYESEEEASRVVKKVDGMHVYGWPIKVKLTTFG
ncbi:hypothetical protein Ddye_006376 [Dipteronia dyeriana]|uniref:RRM domain-containing protein n=1 Tax=Dipteronia dyeriana TaxID=168575 RepID=A0AAD9XIX3_9ROSI|nr:hypothetical protein Ddye_006376 [Dipteronia dyeriana]